MAVFEVDRMGCRISMGILESRVGRPSAETVFSTFCEDWASSQHLCKMVRVGRIRMRGEGLILIK